MSQNSPQRVILVTGPSGAGRSTAIHVLEDLGFEAIDNLPLSLIPRVLEGPPLERPLALGLDARNRDFSAPGMLDLMENLREGQKVDCSVLYLDARSDVLIRRFSETRRRHPLAPSGAPSRGIEREFELLAAVRDRAEFLIDTSDLSPHDLRRQLQEWFAIPGKVNLAVSLTSFSYKRGVPRDADMVFDCRFLSNPHWEPALRALTGRDPEVAGYVEKDPRFADFMERIEALTFSLLPAFKQEGKSHLSICFGCTGGQHRSVSVTERLSKTLANKGWQVSIRHRELERRVG